MDKEKIALFVKNTAKSKKYRFYKAIGGATSCHNNGELNICWIAYLCFLMLLFFFVAVASVTHNEAMIILTKYAFFIMTTIFTLYLFIRSLFTLWLKYLSDMYEYASKICNKCVPKDFLELLHKG